MPHHGEMILFLDFDGVLHPMPANDEGLFCRTPLLWQILRACPHVEVVFSTSWREMHDFELLLDVATHGGGEDMAHRFIGATDESDDAKPLRESECHAWMQVNRPMSDWIALDDQESRFLSNSSNLYLVDYRTGLTPGDVEACIGRISKGGRG